MSQFICQAKSDPVLLAARDEITAGHKAYSETLKFINKQIKDADQRATEIYNSQWAIVEKRLAELNLLPADYKKGGPQLQLSDSAEEFIYKSRQELDDERFLQEVPRALRDVFKPQQAFI